MECLQCSHAFQLRQEAVLYWMTMTIALDLLGVLLDVAGRWSDARRHLCHVPLLLLLSLQLFRGDFAALKATRLLQLWAARWHHLLMLLHLPALLLQHFFHNRDKWELTHHLRAATLLTTVL